MLILRNRISDVVTWGIVAQALWMGFPSTACRCADGGFKLFCTAHLQHSAVEQQSGQPAKALSDCCQHANVVVRHDCRQSPEHYTNEVSSEGCTPLPKLAVVALVPAPTHLAADHAVAVYPLTLEAPHTSAATAAFEAARVDTGPPVDLVISLHCLLI